MKSLVSKFAGLLLMTMVLSGSFVAPAQATTTGAYQWTDISSQLSARQNRPVWAIAYAAPYWYATDGQELWSGGHVWRTDGTYVSDITVEVRNAGLSRVDDIVSDGKTVIYLKNITRRDRNFEMLAYTSGSGYSYPGYQIMQKLDSDEGIVTISTLSESWGILTSKGRVLVYNQSKQTISVASAAAGLASQPAYLQNKTSAPAGQSLDYTLTSDKDRWIVSLRMPDGRMRTSFVSKDGTLSFGGVDSHSTIVATSNGTQTLFVDSSSGGYSGYTVGLAEQTNGVVNHLYTQSNPVNAPTSWNDSIVTWNGKEWFIIANKNAYTFNGSQFTNLGPVKDYFVSAASDANGVTLLAGAESIIGNSQPSSPLMAKLVKIQYGYYNNNNTGSTGSFGGNRVYTSSNGPTVTTSGNPSNFIVGNGKNFVYRVTATDPQGIDRIDLYVNGARIKTCNSDVCEFDNTYYTNGASSRSVTFMTRVTDRSGWSTESSNEYLTIDQSSNGASSGSTGSGSVTNGTTNLWDWVTPSVTSIKRSETVTYGAGAWNSNGLNRVELWVNGSIRRTCTSSSDMNNCTTVLYGSDYGVGSTLSFNAKAVASNGQETWTSLRSLYVNSDSSTNTGSNNNSNGYINTWSNPDVSTLSNGASAVFTVNATDYDGVNRVEILKDGSIVKTCYVNSNGNTTITCEYTVASASNGSATFSARLFDVYNNQVTSNSRTYTFTNSNNTNNGGTTNGQTSIWDWIDPNMTSMNRDQSLTYHVGAWNSNGLNRVELWVNGTIRKTCSGNTQDCAFTINGSDYSANANVAFNARAIDGNGTETWTKLRNLYVSETTTGGTSSVDDNTNAYFFGWSSPDVPNIHIGSSVLYRVRAIDTDGVNRVEILKNGNVVKTCYPVVYGYDSVVCDYTVNADSNGSAIITGRMYDMLGKRITTEARTYTFSNTDPSYTNSGTSTVWDWLTPNVTVIGWPEYIQYHAGAWNEKNINRVELLVNGTVRKVCYGNTQDCALEIHGSIYTPGYTTLRARTTDNNGNVNWTAERTLLIDGGSMGGSGDHPFYRRPTEPSAGSTNPNPSTDSTGTITVSSNRDIGYYSTSYITITAKGSDADGVAKIEILVNGSLQKTCNNLTTCSTTVGPFGSLKTVSYMARMTDKKGNVVKTAYTIINHR